MEPLVWHTSIPGTPPFRGQNLVLEKCPHNLCIYYLFWRDTSIEGKGTLGAKPEFLRTWKVTDCKKGLISLSVPHHNYGSFHRLNYLTYWVETHASSVWNFCIEIPQTSLHGKTSVGIMTCHLFSLDSNLCIVYWMHSAVINGIVIQFSS